MKTILTFFVFFALYSNLFSQNILKDQYFFQDGMTNKYVNDMKNNDDRIHLLYYSQDKKGRRSLSVSEILPSIEHNQTIHFNDTTISFGIRNMFSKKQNIIYGTIKKDLGIFASKYPFNIKYDLDQGFYSWNSGTFTLNGNGNANIEDRYCFTGIKNRMQGYNDLWELTITDSNLNKLKEVANEPSGYDYLGSVVTTTADDCFAFSMPRGVSFPQKLKEYEYIKMDTALNEIWSFKWKNKDDLDIAGFGFFGLSDGGIMQFGYIKYEEDKKTNIYMRKISGDGEILWKSEFGGYEITYASDIIEVDDGFIICGHVAKMSDILKELLPGSKDYYVARTDREGNLIWEKSWGEENVDEYLQKCVQLSDKTIVAAGLKESGIYLAKLEDDYAAVSELEFSSSVKISPNPASDAARAEFTLGEGGVVRIGLADALGREVAPATEKYYPAGANAAQLDLSGLAPGLYYLRITHSGRAETHKVAVVR